MRHLEMDKLTVLIADDEPLACRRLCSMLSERDDVLVIAECGNGTETISQIKQLGPDLVFLDIQMPELNGFQVVEAMMGNSQPVIVFVTAYSDYAIDAFEVEALDYLVKPVSAERLDKSIERAKTKIVCKLEQIKHEQVINALEQARSDRYIERLAVKSGEKVQLVRVGQINYIESAGNYVYIHTSDQKFLLRESMKRLEEKLDPNLFARVHRSTIVNLDCIESLEPTFHGDFTISLSQGIQVPLSRNFRAALRERLGDQI